MRGRAEVLFLVKGLFGGEGRKGATEEGKEGSKVLFLLILFDGGSITWILSERRFVCTAAYRLREELVTPGRGKQL